MATKKSTSTSKARATRTNSRATASRGRNNSMVNNRDKRFMTLVALLAVALISTIGIAVAAVSTNLNIQGTAVVKSTKWDVHFENLKPAVTNSSNNTAKEVTTPTIDTAKTTISNYHIELRNPGDSVTYLFDVKNGGDIDAKLDTIVMKNGSTLTCNSTKGTNADQQARNSATCANLKYTLTYNDSPTFTPVAQNDVFTAGAAKTMRLKLEYTDPTNGTAPYYPDDDVNVSDLGVTLTFVQN